MLKDPTPRYAHLSFRVTPTEREYVQAFASDAGISVGRLIRRALANETSASQRDAEEGAA
jgi:hypothetical protein